MTDDRKLDLSGPPQTHVSFVVDRSGSMQGCWGEMVNAINSWLAEARKDPLLQEADVELDVFDSQSIDNLRKGAPVNMRDLSPAEAMPRGGTPLYDAVGRGIDSLDARLKSSGSFKAVLIIVTDGEENSSKKWRFEQIQEAIKGRQGAGWTVLFLGAGLQAASQSVALGVYAQNAALIGKTSSNLGAVTRSMYAAARGAAATQDFAEAQVYAASPKFSAGDRQAMGDDSGGAWQQNPGGGSAGSLSQAIGMAPPITTTGGTSSRPFTKGMTLDEAKAAFDAQLKAAAQSNPVKDVYEDVGKDAWDRS